jgi:hypothetical protein
MRDSPVVVNIHIKTVDGGVQYPNALSTNVKDGILRVQVGAGGDESDTIYFSPNYWQQYVVDPHSEDPLDLGLDEFDEDDEDDEDELIAEPV